MPKTMAEYFQDMGNSYLADEQKEHLGTPSIYRHGADSVEIKSMHPQQRDDVSDEQGGVVTSRSRDFIFLAADLILNGIEQKPQRGDRIEWNGSVYEVLPVNGDVMFEYSGGETYQIIVHTQEVKAA